MNARAEVVVIGGGVVDIPLSPVTRDIFDRPSTPLESIAMQTGGDAVNEAIVLSRLGHAPALISKAGRDAAGDFLVRTLAEKGVETALIRREAGLDTGVNIVLVSPDGERRFITNRNGSLRRLGMDDILPALDDPSLENVKVACLASLFVSPRLSLADTAELFRAVRARGWTLCADTTRPKNGETLRDLAPLLPRLDVFFPNLDEARALTGLEAPEAVADAFLNGGLKRLALKLGAGGCLIADGRGKRVVPAWPDARCADTTGAGDTFAAGFIAGLLEGRTFADCAVLGNAAASLCIETIGATAGEWTRPDVDARAAEISC